MADQPLAAVVVELVVGLGNPGVRYESTRHNAGYRVVDELRRRYGETGWLRRPLCDVAAAARAPRLILARPRTFMNRSADAVAWLLDHLALTPPQMLVVVDDVELELGALRLRRSGGPGTHNGMRDICRSVGTDFPRLRVGVRGRDAGWDDLAAYVLSDFDADERTTADEAIARAADAAMAVIRHGIDRAMGDFNRRAAPDA